MTPSAQPSTHPVGRPSSQPTHQPVSHPSTQPSSQPSSQPTKQPVGRPSSQPTSQPSARPSSQPIAHPSSQPTSQPSVNPSLQPTQQPSSQPSALPSVQPTSAPTSDPSAGPSMQPSSQPSCSPSSLPTGQPSCSPTSSPSEQPSSSPTSDPSTQPTTQPTNCPTTQPTFSPTSPTSKPTSQPSCQPSNRPSSQPSDQPSSNPTVMAVCPVGNYYVFTGQANVSFECHPCPAGSYSGGILQKNCFLAEPGYYSTEGAEIHVKCPKNFYTEDWGTKDKCRPCPVGYVNGHKGSFKKSDCFDTRTNFAIGSFSILLVIYLIVVYLFWDRLHFVAFRKRHRMVDKCIMLFGTMSITADMVNSTVGLLDRIDTGRTTSLGYKIFHKIFFQFFVFPLLMVIVICLTVGFYIVRTSLTIAFNAMILFRAYQSYLKLDDIYQMLKPFQHEMDAVLGKYNLVYYINFPITYLSNKISLIRIDLNAVKITCTGAQSPLYLVLDMMIVIIVITVIESGVNVFWVMMLPNAMEKIRSVMFNRYYMYNAEDSIFTRIKHWLLSFRALVWAALVTAIPDPRVLVQYCMGFVVVSKFYDSKSWVPYSTNCDGALPNLASDAKNDSFKLDSILANLSGIIFILMMPAALYMLSVVLFTVEAESTIKDFSLPEVESKQQNISDIDEEKSIEDGNEDSVIVASNHSGSPSPINTELSDLDDSYNFVVDIVPYQSFKSLSRKVTRIDLEDQSEAYSGMSSPTSIKTVQVVHLDDNLTNTEFVNNCFNYFAPDRILMGMVFNLGLTNLERYRKFLNTKYTIHAPRIRSEFLSSEKEKLNSGDVLVDCNVEDVRDAFDYDPVLILLRDHAKKVRLEKIVSDVKEGINWNAADDRKEEEDKWNKVKETIPNYYKMSGLVANEICVFFGLDEDPTALRFEASFDFAVKVSKRALKYALFLSSFLPFIQVTTTIGREHWRRVFLTYTGMVLLTAGCWPKWLVRDFKIIEKFEEFKRMSNIAYSDLVPSMFDNGLLALSNEDTFTRIDNDQQIAFSRFVYATVSCRIALLQVFPPLTAVSSMFCALSATPWYVGDDAMSSMLPPLIYWDSFKKAEEWLRQDLNGEDPPMLASFFLGYYLRVNRSRAIQFVIAFLINLVSVVIAFKPKYLIIMVPIIIFVVVHQGLLAGGYVFLLFKKLFFPPELYLYRSKNARIKKFDAVVANTRPSNEGSEGQSGSSTKISESTSSKSESGYLAPLRAMYRNYSYLNNSSPAKRNVGSASPTFCESSKATKSSASEKKLKDYVVNYVAIEKGKTRSTFVGPIDAVSITVTKEISNSAALQVPNSFEFDADEGKEQQVAPPTTTKSSRRKFKL